VRRQRPTDQVRYNPDHRWKYVRAMVPEEFVLIKRYGVEASVHTVYRVANVLTKTFWPVSILFTTGAWLYSRLTLRLKIPPHRGTHHIGNRGDRASENTRFLWLTSSLSRNGLPIARGMGYDGPYRTKRV
jgi:hypothetical protein